MYSRVAAGNDFVFVVLFFVFFITRAKLDSIIQSSVCLYIYTMRGRRPRDEKFETRRKNDLEIKSY